jgi:hypothetical protein
MLNNHRLANTLLQGNLVSTHRLVNTHHLVNTHLPDSIHQASIRLLDSTLHPVSTHRLVNNPEGNTHRHHLECRLNNKQTGWQSRIPLEDVHQDWNT